MIKVLTRLGRGTAVLALGLLEGPRELQILYAQNLTKIQISTYELKLHSKIQMNSKLGAFGLVE